MANEPLFYSEDDTFNLSIAFFTAAFPTVRIDEKSFLGHTARALAQLVAALQQAQKQAYYDGIPGYQLDYDGIIRSRCSSQALDNWAFTFGLKSNRGAGKYGRNAAVAATGGQGQVTGVVGTLVPAGTQATDPSGQITVALVSAVTIPLSGTITGTFNSQVTGAASNLPINTVLRWVAPPVGCNPTVTLSVALSGGYDEESDLDLVGRLIRHLQNPPGGGRASDYREWGETATDANGKLLGVTRAYVYPHRNGIGSVDVVITQKGSGTSRDPGATIAAQVLTYINDRKIATDTARVIRPYFPAGQSIRMWVAIVPGAAYYNFDWDDSFAQAINTYSAVAPTIVLVGATPPVALKNAINNGSQPRIQVGITGFPIPQIRRALAYADNTPGAGFSTLTLNSPLPAGGVSFAICCAGSSAVEPIAQAVMDYVNSIGPSIQSGYQDQTDRWVSEVTVGGICAAALSVVDENGVKLASYSEDVGMGTGVTISVGVGNFLGNDKKLFDNVPGQGPELPNPTLCMVLRQA